jgi:PEP-CTERM motif
VLTGDTTDTLLAIDNINAAVPSQAPEPTSIALLGAGLAGLVLVGRRRRATLGRLYRGWV